MTQRYESPDCARQLRELGFQRLFDADDGVILVPWKGRSGVHHLAIQIEETGEQRTLSIVAHGIGRAETITLELAEALLEINEYWILGALSRRTEDGLVCFRLAYPLDDRGPGDEQLGRMVCAAGACVDEAATVVHAVRHGVPFATAMDAARGSTEDATPPVDDEDGPSEMAI